MQAQPQIKPPQLPQKKSSPPASRNRSSKDQPDFSFHPVRRLILFTLSIPLVITASSAAAYFTGMDFSDPAEPTAQVYTDSDYFELGTTTFFKDEDALVITTQVSKKDPYIRTYGGYISYDVLVNGVKQQTYASAFIPSLGFDEQTFYVSTSVTGINADEADIQVVPNLDPDYDVSTTSIWEYDYLSDDSNVDEADLLALYNQSPYLTSRYTLEILNDGLSSQDSHVKFQVSTADGSKEYISGLYNILFKKDGQVVFADSDYFSSVHGSDASLTVNYHSPFALPEYDEVEIQLME